MGNLQEISKKQMSLFRLRKFIRVNLPWDGFNVNLGRCFNSAI